MPVQIDSLIAFINKEYPEVLFEGREINCNDLVFEERVHFNCFYCGKYGTNWKCPPNLPELNYQKLLCEYDHLAFIWIRAPFQESNYDEVRTESSVVLHKALLKMEEHLWGQNSSTSVSFIGGSCKLCKNGCGEKKCNNPYQARSPLEATGLNIIATAKKYGIEIKFPPENAIMRLGLLAW